MFNLRTIIFITVAFSLFSCSENTDGKKEGDEATATTNKNVQTTLRIAAVPTMECVSLGLLSSASVQQALGAKIPVVVKFYCSQFDCDTALLGGSVDMSVMDNQRRAYYEAKGHHFKEILSLRGEQGIVLGRNVRLRSIADLSRKLVGMSRHSVSSQFLSQTLSAGKVLAEDVLATQINDLALRKRMLITGQVEIAILPEPWLTASILEGARLAKIQGARQEYEASLVVLTANDSKLKSKVSSLKKFYAEIQKRKKEFTAQRDSILKTQYELPQAVIDSINSTSR